MILRALSCRPMGWALLATSVLLLGVPAVALAQAGLANPEAIASQSLRGYTHMFIAYAIAWALVFGWVISIARRLARLERAVGDA